MSVNLILSPHFPRELLPYDNSFAGFTLFSKRKQNYDFSLKPPQFHIDFPFLLTSTAPLPVQLKNCGNNCDILLLGRSDYQAGAGPHPEVQGRVPVNHAWDQEEPRLLVVEAKLLPGTVGAAFFLSAITGFCGRGEQVQSFLCVGYNNICKLFFRPKKTFFLLITSFFVIISTVSYKLIGGLFLFVLSYSYFIIDISMDPKHQ